MKIKSSRFALVALLCAMPLTAAFAGPNSVPLKASIDTEETLRPDPTSCQTLPYLAGATTGNGTASHLGLVTLVATDCFTPNPTSYSFDRGSLTLVAANGDSLKAVYSGVLSPTAATSSVFSISGNFTVVGGTGRFSGATGSGYIQGTEDVATGKGHFDITGTLAY